MPPASKRPLFAGELLRDISRRKILLELRRHDALARINISEATGLSPATVTTVTSELLEAGLIRYASPLLKDVNADTRGRGRPKVELALNPDAFYLAGVMISEDRISVAVVNFIGDVVSDEECHIDTRAESLEELARRARAMVDRASAAAHLSTEDLSAIGFGLPGLIESETGTCFWTPMGFDTPTLLREVFQSQFTSPVVVDNDANLAALAELWFGKGRGLSDFVVITLNYGVGMGMIHGGRLMRGTRNLGPELGHTKIVPHGRACRCGQLGCLEAYVGDYALLSEAEVQGLAWQGNTDAEAMEALGAAADDGNPVAVRVLSEAAEYFGIGIANLLNLFDPVQIILALEGDKPILKYLDVIERTLRENAIAGPPHKLELVTHKWGDQLWTRGAAARALEALFADPIMARKSEELAAASS